MAPVGKFSSLVLDAMPRHIGKAMHVRFRLRLMIAVLALLMGTGAILSAVQASDMALKMAMSGDVPAPGAKGCGACGENDGDIKPAACLPACVNAAHALLPAAAVVGFDTAETPPIAAVSPPLESTGVPDPSPPRASILG